MTDIGGPYWGLAHAQQLSLGDDSSTATTSFDPEKQDRKVTFTQERLRNEFDAVLCAKPTNESKSFLGSFALFLWEQKPHWGWYCLMMLGALGAGGNYIQVNV